MNTEQAYNEWSKQYDTNENKTRDLEAIVLRNTLSQISFINCLEVGCGTGKNTAWLMEKAQTVLAIDLSEAMLAKAKEKITANNVTFLQVDINKPWNFTDQQYDLVSFSLVLEHIENLDFIFSEVAKVVPTGGHVFVGELHPFKQYNGSKARFETEEGVQVVPCFNHHVSDFVQAARKHSFQLADLNEYFDKDDRTSLPRILAILFRKV